MSLILRPPGDPPPLTERLHGLGVARTAARTAAGVFTLVAVGLAAMAAACVLDAGLHLPAAPRAVALALTLGLVGYLFARGVRRPLREPRDPLAVAHLLERGIPLLNDALASAVAFLRQDDDPRHGAARFRRVAVIRAENLAERCDLGSVVPTRAAWRAWWLFAAVGLVTAGLVFANPGRAAHAAVRFADPFGDHPWPARTRVEFVSPAFPALLARGEPFVVKFAVRGAVPGEAVVELRYAGHFAASTDPVPLTPPEGKSDRAEGGMTFAPDRVSRNFEVRVTADDGDTGWRPVRVAPPPRLVPRAGRPSPQVSLTYPAYTQLPPADLPDGATVVEAVSGTRVRLRAATDRRLTAAVLRPPADDAGGPTLAAIAPAAGFSPFGVLGAALLADGFAADIPVAVGGPEGRDLDADFTPSRPGLYSLCFTDEEGLTGVRLLDLRFFPDPAPTVLIERPAAGQDPFTVLPTATLTVRARAEDRVFAARRLTLEYRVGDVAFREIVLADVAPTGVALPAVASPAALPVRPQPIALQGSRPVPIAAFIKPDGTAPADGDVITLRAAATDWDDVTPMKQPGRSPEVQIRVLSPASFDTMLQKELAGLRPELSRLKDEQADATAKLKEAAKAFPQVGKSPIEPRESLAQAEQAQKQVAAKLEDKSAGARAKAEQLRDLVKANELPRTPVTDRAEAVARALGRADDEHMQKVGPAITAAKQAADKPDPKGVKDALANAAKYQDGVTASLSAALEQLERWAGAGELRGDVRGVKEQSNQAAREAAKAADRTPEGVAPEKLSPAEKADLNRAAEPFDKAAAEANALVAKAGRVAAEKEKQAQSLKAEAAAKRATAESDTMKAEALKADATALDAAAERAAAEAAALKKAVARAGGQALPEDLRKAADATRQNRPGEASAAKQSADARLDKMQDELAERKDDADELRKKTKAAQDVDKLADAQDELRKKAKSAGGNSDPGKRADDLKKLAPEQQKLRAEAEKLAERLTREGNDPAAEDLKRAAERMEQNREQLEQGTPPGEKQQQEALDRLDDAKDKLDAERAKDQDGLQREKQEELLKEFRGLVERQRAAVAEADRVQAEAVKAKKWSRPLAASLSDLADREDALSAEVRRFAGKKLAELKVFDRMAREAADQMNKAAVRLRERKDDALTADPAEFDADAETAAAAITGRPLKQALQRLEQMLAAASPDKDQKPPAGGGPMGGGGGGKGGGGGPSGGGGVPPLAQLKALRDWQAEVNERTAAFAKAHPDRAKIASDEADELKEIEVAQKEIADLFGQLLPLFQPKGADVP